MKNRIFLKLVIMYRFVFLFLDCFSSLHSVRNDVSY